MPELHTPPSLMRVHNPSTEEESTNTNDHVVFWPIGQKVFSQVVRELLDLHCSHLGRDKLSELEVIDALVPLHRVKWSLHELPWRHLLLIPSLDQNNTRWAMRSEGRASAIAIAQEVLDFVVGISLLDQEEEDELKEKWAATIVPMPDPEGASRMWSEIRKQALS